MLKREHSCGISQWGIFHCIRASAVNGKDGGFILEKADCTRYIRCVRQITDPNEGLQIGIALLVLRSVSIG